MIGWLGGQHPTSPPNSFFDPCRLKRISPIRASCPPSSTDSNTATPPLLAPPGTGTSSGASTSTTTTILFSPVPILPPKLGPRMNTSAHPHSLSAQIHGMRTQAQPINNQRSAPRPLLASMCNRTTALCAKHDVRIEADLHPRRRKQMRRAAAARRPRRVSWATVHFFAETLFPLPCSSRPILLGEMLRRRHSYPKARRGHWSCACRKGEKEREISDRKYGTQGN